MHSTQNFTYYWVSGLPWEEKSLLLQVGIEAFVDAVQEAVTVLQLLQ